MNIKYGSGFVQGFYSKDVISVGGLTVPSMDFGEATLAMDNEHGTLFSGMQVQTHKDSEKARTDGHTYIHKAHTHKRQRKAGEAQVSGKTGEEQEPASP